MSADESAPPAEYAQPAEQDPASADPAQPAEADTQGDGALENKEQTSAKPDDEKKGDEIVGDGRRRYSDPHAKTTFAAKLNFWQQVAVQKPPVVAPATPDVKQKDPADEKAAPRRPAKSTPPRRTSAVSPVAAANASGRSAASVPSSPTLQVPNGKISSVKDRMKQFSAPVPAENISRSKKEAPSAPQSLLRLSQIQKAVERGTPIAPEVSSSLDKQISNPIPEETVEEKKDAQPDVHLEAPNAQPEIPKDAQPELPRDALPELPKDAQVEASKDVQPVHPVQPEHHDQPVHPVQPEHHDQPVHPAQPEHHDQPVHLAQPEHHDQPVHHAKPEHHDQPKDFVVVVEPAQPEPTPSTSIDDSKSYSQPAESNAPAAKQEGFKPVLAVDVPFNDTLTDKPEFNLSSPNPIPPSMMQSARNLQGIGEMVGHMYDAVDHADDDEPKFSGTGKLEEMKVSLNPSTDAPTEDLDLHKYDIKRSLVREEIIATEKSYIANLGILIEKFAHPLKASDKFGVSQEQAARIFSNVEIIAHFHDKLYEEFQRPDVNVGDVFFRYADFLKMYSQYLNGYETSMSVINTLSSNRQFKSFLETRRQDPGVHLDFMSYLILPVQRIPRYELLLREYVKNTPEGHPEREVLLSAFAKIQKIAQHINESKRRVENMSKVLAIQNKIEGNMDVPLLAPHRRLIKEGNVDVQRTGLLGHTYRKRIIFLFNDSFLTTADDYSFKDWVLLEGDSFAFTLIDDHGRYGFACKYKDHDEKYFCASEAERDEWISLLNATREAYEEVVNAAKERNTRPASGSVDTPEPPPLPPPRTARSPSLNSFN